jgi:hypothetical protein
MHYSEFLLPFERTLGHNISQIRSQEMKNVCLAKMIKLVCYWQK